MSSPETLLAQKPSTRPAALPELASQNALAPIDGKTATEVAAPAETITPTVVISSEAMTAAATLREPRFSRALFQIVTALLGVQLLLLVGNLWFQFHNYATGIRLAERAGATADIVSLILIYSRAWDFAVTKTSALFLGFMVIYLGALYVLRSADTAYELSFGQGSQPNVSLKSSSPGLVMITLGTLLVGLVLSNRSEVGFQVSPAGTQEDGATAISATTATAVPSGSASAASPARAAAGLASPARSGGSSAHPAIPNAPAPAEDHRTPKLLDP